MTTLWRAGLPVLVLTLSGGATAWAQSRDGFSMTASYSLQHDSNLFRIPDGVDPQMVLSGASGAEDIGITSAGLRYAQTYSLQRVELELSLVDYRYHTYSQQNLLAKNHDAAWHWQLTPRMRGSLTSDRKATVNSFDNASGVSIANQRVISHTSLDALYEVDGVWRLVGGLHRSREKNQQQQIGQDSYSSRSAEAGLRYDAKSGSHLVYRLRQSSGRTFDASGSIPSTQRDDEFEQLDNELKARWAFSGKSSFDLGFTHIDRTHPRLSERDYSGINAAADLNWEATGKTLWSAGLSRELSSYQTSNASYAQADQLRLGFSWLVAPRTTLRANIAETSRRYLGAPAGQASDPRRDTTRDSSLVVNWSVHQNMSVNASWQRTQRRSNQPGLAFSSNQLVLGTSVGF